MFRVITLFAVLALATTTGCKDHHSSRSLPTKRVHPQFTVETDGAGLSRIHASLVADYTPFLGYTYIQLEYGDVLEVRSPSGETASFDGPERFFEHAFLTGTQPARFQFDFWRGEAGRINALDSSGVTPQPMDLGSPASGSEHSPTNPILVQWSGAGTENEMSLRVQAACTDPEFVDDDHAFEIEFSVDSGMEPVVLADHADFSAECERYQATLTLVRTAYGRLDAEYAPGPDCEEAEHVSEDCDDFSEFALRQVRDVEVTLMP